MKKTRLSYKVSLRCLALMVIVDNGSAALVAADRMLQLKLMPSLSFIPPANAEQSWNSSQHDFGTPISEGFLKFITGPRIRNR